MCRKLRRREHDRRSPSSPPSDGSRESKDFSYRHRFRSPPSESYSTSSCQNKFERNSNKCEKKTSYRGMGSHVMSKALQQISKLPFVRRINKAKLPHLFSQPTFTIYNGRTDPVEHVSHFNQKMAIYSDNEAFLCKIFPSSLGLVAMCWSDALEEGSIRSFEELARTFRARFITSSKIPKLVDSFLSMAMREGETLKTYSDRYWETYN